MYKGSLLCRRHSYRNDRARNIHDGSGNHRLNGYSGHLWSRFVPSARGWELSKATSRGLRR